MPELSISQVYYTYDHEWINFQGEFAYMGVCSFKLLGFRNIKDISFSDPVIGFKKKGTLLAVIKSAEYQIEAYMPVDGIVLGINQEFLAAHPHVLLTDPEKKGWIAKIQPLFPTDRSTLLSSRQYRR